MSWRRFGSRASMGFAPAAQRPSTHSTPLRSSCSPLRIVDRFQPSADCGLTLTASAQPPYDLRHEDTTRVPVELVGPALERLPYAFAQSHAARTPYWSRLFPSTSVPASIYPIHPHSILHRDRNDTLWSFLPPPPAAVGHQQARP